MQWQLLIPKMAIFNASHRRVPADALAAAILLFAAAGALFAGETQNKVFAARAEAEFHRAQIQFQSGTNNLAAWQFARACFDFADWATNDTERADIANQGISACRELIAREPDIAAAHYYLGLNLGQLARTEMLGALEIVKAMEREFKTADKLDARFDFAGPARSLGLLYRDAPGWPASIGSRRKARQWLERAAKLAPDFPENRLNLVESFLQWHESENAKIELKTLDSLWPEARTNFTGEIWEQSWADWSSRRDAAREKLNEIPNPVKTPKNSG
jgi:tetratricopeptide (TPR) repeat protein